MIRVWTLNLGFGIQDLGIRFSNMWVVENRRKNVEEQEEEEGKRRQWRGKRRSVQQEEEGRTQKIIIMISAFAKTIWVEIFKFELVDFLKINYNFYRFFRKKKKNKNWDEKFEFKMVCQTETQYKRIRCWYYFIFVSTRFLNGLIFFN